MNRVRALLFCLALMLITHVAAAGALVVRDGARLLSSTDVTSLETSVRPYPFDVLVVTSSDAATKDEFDRRITADVRANALVVGIDETHRHTSVRFGNSLGIDRGQFRAIEEAGSPYFKQKQWRSGIDAIVNRASQNANGSAVGTASPSTSGAPANSRASAKTGFFVAGLVVIVVVALGIVLIATVLRRVFGSSRQMGPGGPGYGPQGGYGYGPQGGPGPFGQNYGPGYGAGGGGGGGSGLGAGLIGAGLGGLAGYELGRMAGRQEHGSDEPHRSGHDHDASTDPSGDAGGASSDWDESSTNADIGGSGWDDSGSGGGGDWGSGGDSGSDGGGSDW